MKVSDLLLLSLLSTIKTDMDFKHKIKQWNCRGLKPKFDELSLLLTQQKPSIFVFK